MNQQSTTPQAPRAPQQRNGKDGDDDLTGLALGRYVLLRKLGKGGMGVVYEAEDNLLNRRVAVKLLPYTKNPGARMLERFYRLAGTAGEGTGLGLAIAEEIARVHNSHLQVLEGYGGRGLRMRLSLPA